ncbi:MAG: adenine phosphoribosyltransferase [candidate division Zixibacteria bacterium]
MSTKYEHLKKFIREVPDFPKKGINFYDISTLFSSPEGLAIALDAIGEYAVSRQANKILGIEARGFIVGAPIADRLNLPFIPARKPGKLPYNTISEEYMLEYGKDRLEIHADAIRDGDRVLIVDDLIATGGTLEASCRLVERSGGDVAGISAIIALPFLQFQPKLSGYDLHYLISYDSE